MWSACCAADGFCYQPMRQTVASLPPRAQKAHSAWLVLCMQAHFCECSAAPAVCTNAVLVHQQACSGPRWAAACSSAQPAEAPEAGVLRWQPALCGCLRQHTWCPHCPSRAPGGGPRAQDAVAQRSADGGAGDGGAQHPSSTPPRSWRCMCARREARWARRRRWRPRSARSACRRRRLVRRASPAPSGKAGCEEVARGGGTSKRSLITVCWHANHITLTQKLGWCGEYSGGYSFQDGKQGGSTRRLLPSA